MGSQEEEVLEQVPLYTLTNLDDGKQEKLILVVALPGIQSASELLVILHVDLISVRAPGRYNLALPLTEVTIATTAEMINFSRKKAVLKAEFLVTGHVEAPEKGARPTSASDSSGSTEERKRPQTNGGAGGQREVHDSFLAEAMKLRDGKSQKPPPSRSPASAVDEGLPRNGRNRGARAGPPASSSNPGPTTPAPPVPGRGAPITPPSREAQAPHPPASGDRAGRNDGRRSRAATAGNSAKGTTRGEEAASGSTSRRSEPGLPESGTRRPVAGGQPGIQRAPNGSCGARAASSGRSRGDDSSLSSGSGGGGEGDAESDSGSSGSSVPSLGSVEDETQRGYMDDEPSDRVTIERPSVPYANPELQASNREAGEECHTRARTAVARGDLPAAIRLLTKATSLDPLNPVYHRELAEALEEQLGATGARTQRQEASQSRKPPGEQPQEPAYAGGSSKAGSSSGSQKKASAGPGGPSPRPAAPKESPPQTPPERRSPSPEPLRTDPPRTWESALEDFYHDWSSGLPGLLLVTADSIGLTTLADRLCVVSQRQGTSGYMWLWLCSLLLLLVVAGTGVGAGFLLLRIFAPYGFGVAKWGVFTIFSLLLYLLYPISWCLSFIRRVLVLLLWRPPWWSSIVIAYMVTCLEKPWAMLWPYPLMWWLTGGRYWFLYGTPVSFGLSVFLRCQFYASNLWLVVVRCSFVYLPWWAATVVMLLCLVALLLCGNLDMPDNQYRGKLTPEIPEGAVGEVARILGASDYYEVLEVERGVEEAAVRKAKRVKVLLVHPDKLTGDAAIGAAEAFHRVTEAHDTLSDQRLRQKYDRELAEAERLEQASRRYEDSGSEGMTALAMTCPHCEARGNRDATHTATCVSRPVHAARYCKEHDTYHEAQPGDIWLESHGLWGYKAYLCSASMVLDITEWVNCNKVNFKARYGGMAKDTHWPLTSARERDHDDARSPRSSQTGSQQGNKKKKKGGRNKTRR